MRLNIQKLQSSILKAQQGIAIQRNDNTKVAPIKMKVNTIPLTKQQQYNFKNFGSLNTPQQIHQTLRQQPLGESLKSKKIAEENVNTRERLAKFTEEQRIDKERELKVAPYAAMGLVGTITGTLPAMIGSEIGGRTVDKVSEKLTGKSWGENVLPKYPGIGALTNPGYILGGTAGAVATNLDRKIAEIGLRAGDFNVDKLKHTLLDSSTHKYLLTGDENILKTAGSREVPFSNKAIHDYNGSIKYSSSNPADLNKGDYVDIFLGRNKPTDFREIKTNDFGIHNDYINKNYPTKKNNIRTFSTSSSDEPSIKPVRQVNIDSRKKDFNPTTGIRSMEGEIIGDLGGVDAGGHLEYIVNQGDNFITTQKQDIWKYNPKDYMNKWERNSLDSPLKKLLINPIKKAGLNLLDRVGNPIITKGELTKYVVDPSMDNIQYLNNYIYHL